jgi:FtsZ-interacting cell division protein ZipA
MAARRIILYVLYVLVLVGLIAAIVVAFHSNDNNKNETKKQTTAKQQAEQQQKQAQAKTKQQQEAAKQKAAQQKAAEQKAAEQKKQQGGQVATNTPGAATQQAKPAYTAPTTQTAPGTAAGGKGGQEDLTNTGPGEVAALFGTVVVGGTLYYSYRQRKQLV